MGKLAAMASPLPTTGPSTAAATLYRRDVSTTVAISGCSPVFDEIKSATLCACPFPQNGPLPLKTGPGGVCDYSSATVNAFPFTSTLSNSAVVAFQDSSLDASGTAPLGSIFDNIGVGANTTLQAGKSITMEINPTASQAVGTLTGTELFTSVSNAIKSACSTPSGGTPVSSCSAATISNIIIVNSNGDSGGGDLAVTFPFVSYDDLNTFEALVVAVAGAFQVSSSDPANTKEFEVNESGDSGLHGIGSTTPVNITTIGALAQAIVTIQTAEDTNGDVKVQNLAVNLALEGNAGTGFDCSAVALVNDGLGALSLITGLLGLIPGFEWAELVEIPLILDAEIEAISLSCDISGELSS
ncbi:hypothetical protein LTR56_000510 [Elasticomyces elasticus]|nr:hypothetical protein LTR22_014238 [Elasticomyces elasticus]KAK3660752.1 hypothetical protein LTR56_000510 [Elasticomyces elasticus]KAK4922898.1 hypothetical protein LTR49_009905 [Elasticomyces elasticus]KAK5759726.1 hypothetical protein LTS12_010066 [Elasticomyces elasticus]